ncbi:bifunctional diguanylate cyclase/phosphodiesterase [Variovorax sp. J22P168]|uniref:putative bifunctional diguanylate cyclase/phosphodiesterase n=1 Tax=Variovorax jilinensis TaxID=3053513 RepID=UPI002576BB7E|nr:bifunctional diguanylate cyclase/phosphodiesterase [Variovorax sp. J22P168]MDM0013474.1 bifunctional diguanylate cyclase/phosphodiesterase [Variovorax sp. J22P168]
MPTRTLVGHLKICDGLILWADEDAHTLLEYPSGALTDMPFEDILPVSVIRSLKLPARGAVDGRRVGLKGRNGRDVQADLRGERMEDRCALWSFTPTAVRARGERLDLLSRHDALTRLPNRVPSTQELAPATPLARAGGPLLAVCYLDLDRFRDINDKFGPLEGDAVLREVARRLKAGVPGNASVSRVGGDEFALLLAVDDKAQAEELLAQVLARLAHPFRLQDGSAQLRTSVGVALMPRGEQPTEVMLQHARHAVFFAKRAGGSQVHFFDAGQAREDEEGVAIRQQIVAGLARHEFLLAFQPKVDMRCGRVIGFEALVRWHHPTRGLLQPGAFVAQIDDYEVVEQLGDWAIGEALRQAAEWQAAGVRTSVSVNISPRHLLRPGFIERLGVQLARHPQLQPGVLELEILETTAIKDFAAVSAFIGACSALGVPVVMDDFGTGYSSLTYLRRLPVSALKLDQSFVRGMLDDPEDEAIIRGILVMARGFGRQTIAEGVESIAHGSALLALGCTLGQGYGIAKPLAAAEVPAWIAGFEQAPPWGRAADC